MNTSRTLRSTVIAVATVVLLAGAATAAGLSMDPPSLRAAFIADNDAAMAKMMSGMRIGAIGDIDRDFASMMIAHHQGAVEMAETELRYGSNERLRRIAQGIIVEQQQEIVAMRNAADQPIASPRGGATDVSRCVTSGDTKTSR